MSIVALKVIQRAMLSARNAANYDRMNCEGYQKHYLMYEIGVIRGIEYATPHDDENDDAFMGARNELNFLFGRYQEMTT